MSASLHLGDCLDVMPAIPAGSVDMVLCDLPYGTTACRWDAVLPFDRLWAEYRRVTKPNAAIVLTASQPFTSALVASNYEWFKYEWIWRKSRATGHVHAKNKPLKAHENILVFSQGTTVHESQSALRMDYHPQGMTALTIPKKRSGSWQSGQFNGNGGRRPSDKDTIQTMGGYPTSILDFGSVNHPDHPTQKPVALMEYLILTYTNKGDTVLDNTMGSGTTGVACRNTGRKFIGIEREPSFFAIAQRRIEDAPPQGALFLEATE